MSRISPAFAAVLVAVLVAPPALAASGRVWRSLDCECCSKWVEHMKSSGFELEQNDMPRSRLNGLKQQFGLKPEQASCHTAMIDGYVIEGHVPASDVERLLREKPDAVGLAVPKMPVGSPGMEQGDVKEPYDVLLIKRDGATEVYSSHNK